jgi:hypothetical protein
MVFNPENGLPYLASAILTSIGLIMLIRAYFKGIKRIKIWIIVILFHNIALYVQFVGKQ